MKTIITGGAGFIGSNLVRALVKRRHTVKVIDNLKTGRLKNLAGIEKRITFVKGDIRNLSLLKREFKGYEAVLHHAAFISVPKSVKQPLLCADHNVNGTLSVLEAARYSHMQRVVFASSCSVYGSTKRGTKTREKQPLNPLSPYALSKIVGEQYCKLFTEIYDLPTIILRYFNVYGQYHQFIGGYANAIPSLLSKLLSNQNPIIYGNGEQARDFVFIDDVIAANFKALSAPKIAYGSVFNIGSGEATTIKQLLVIIKKRLALKGIDYRQKIIYKKARLGDVRYIRADTKKSSDKLGFISRINLVAGIDRYIDSPLK